MTVNYFIMIFYPDVKKRMYNMHKIKNIGNNDCLFYGGFIS